MKFFFGDSHIRQFFLDLSGNYSVNWFSGSTAQGLLNTNSKTAAGTTIMSFCKNLFPSLVCVQFGSVDMDFTLIKKLHEDKNLDINLYLKSVVIRYSEFIFQIADYVENLHVLGIHLPTTLDSHCSQNISWNTGLNEDIVKNIIYDRELNSSRRIALAIEFNDLCECAFRYSKVNFHRIDKAMLDQNNEVHPRFIIKPWEHHANKIETAKLWAPLLGIKID